MKRILLGIILIALTGCRTLPTGNQPAAIDPPTTVIPAPYDEAPP